VDAASSKTYPGNNPSIKVNAVTTASLIKLEIGCSNDFQFNIKSTYKNPINPNSELLHPKNAGVSKALSCMKRQ
jgi:hypothetical protein